MASDRRAAGFSQYYDSETVPRQPGQNSRRNSTSSSFYNPRASQNRPAGDRDMYYDAGPALSGKKSDAAGDPNDGWDVYADFNNAGPRYGAIKAGASGYQPLGSPAPKGSPATPGPNGDGVELVTVPALGAEWHPDEIKAMTKKGRSEEKNIQRKERWKAWTRNQSSLCGGWGTRKVIVWTVFILCCVAGIILAFTVPRPPKFEFNSVAPLANSTDPDSIPPVFKQFPAASFAFNASLDLRIDTGNSFTTLKINHLRAEVADLDTSRQIATGDLYGLSFGAKTFTQLFMPLTFNYTAVNNTDRTWADMYNACRNSNQYPDRIRPGVSLRVALFMDIAGLITRPATSTTITSAPCPFELPASAG